MAFLLLSQAHQQGDGSEVKQPGIEMALVGYQCCREWLNALSHNILFRNRHLYLNLLVLDPVAFYNTMIDLASMLKEGRHDKK